MAYTAKGADVYYTNGTIVPTDACRDAYNRIDKDPGSITDDDVLLVKTYYGKDAGARMIAAREQARQPIPPPMPAVAATDAPLTLREANDLLVGCFEKERDPSFDRDAFAKAIKKDRAASLPPIRPGAYDGERYLVARAQWKCAPEALTDQDIEQLTLVNVRDGEQARLARLGITTTTDDRDAQEHDAVMARLPVSAKALLVILKNGVEHWIATVQTIARECRARLDVVEQRLGAPVDDQGKLARAAEEIAALAARVKTLEARPHLHFRGTWRSDATYEPGGLVVHKGGLWICHAAVTAAVPGGFMESSRSWQLVTKSH